MTTNRSLTWKTAVFAPVAMIAFAANSILCRLALGPPDIDAAAFTTIRLLSGATMLLGVARLSGRGRTPKSRGNWTSGASLFAYAILFSFAYQRLDVGTGALILFALVQATMIAWGLVRRERPRPLQWLGLATALGGLLYLVSPGLSAPPVIGSLMMGTAGLAWGVYSLRGRITSDPIVTTTDNFVRSLPFVLIVATVSLRSLDLSLRGILLAVASGALTSGFGYVLWYEALRGLSATRAATVQLTVPIIAALGGLLFLGEQPSLRLAVSALLIVGGVGLTLIGREKAAGKRRGTLGSRSA